MNAKVTDFPEEVARRVGNYVYRLIDPRNGETFYVGKGRRNRVFQHVQAAGIEGQWGTHCMRHGFATRMLNAGHSLKAIADLIGHRCITSTFIYTKVEFEALREAALEWPEEAR